MAWTAHALTGADTKVCSGAGAEVKVCVGAGIEAKVCVTAGAEAKVCVGAGAKVSVTTGAAKLVATGANVSTGAGVKSATAPLQELHSAAMGAAVKVAGSASLIILSGRIT